MSLEKAQPSPRGSRIEHREFANHKNEIERQIIVQLVTDILAAGYRIAVNDGEETVTGYLAQAPHIYGAMSSTDMDRLLLVKGEGDAAERGWVLLIYGNDADVISDYTVNLDELCEKADAVAEKFRR